MLNLFGRGKKRERRQVAEGALLTRYLEPSRLPSEYAQEDWEESLHKTYKRVVQELMSSGALRRPTVREGLQLARVKDIKPVLRELDLKVSGRKAELMERLIEHAPNEAKKLATKHGQDALVVTEAGRDRALTFQEERQRRKVRAQEQVRRFLKSGDVNAACDIVNEFYRWLPANMRPGLNMDWENPEGGIHSYSKRVRYILQDASKSWVVEDLPAELRETMLLHAAEDELWPEGIPSGIFDAIDNRAEELEEPVQAHRRLRTIRGWATQKEHEDTYAEMGVSVAYGPPAHLGCRCWTSADLLSNYDWVVLWRTSNDHLVCTDTMNVPWGTVAGCADLRNRVVSNGPYWGMRLSEAREMAEGAE